MKYLRLFEQYDNKNMIPGNIYKMEGVDDPLICFIGDNSIDGDVNKYIIITIDITNNYYTVLDWEQNRILNSTNMTLKSLIMENKIDIKKIIKDFSYAQSGYNSSEGLKKNAKNFYEYYIKNDRDIQSKIKSNEFNL